MKFLSLLLICIYFIQFSWAQSQADWAALNKRVEELEKQQSDYFFQSEARETKVNSFLKSNLTFGGFFEPAFVVLDGEDTHLQGANVSNLLGLNLAADFAPRLKFVSQFITGLTFPYLNEHNDPKAPTVGLPETREYTGLSYGSILTQGYVQYALGEHHLLMGGVGYVPFGYYAQQREPVLFVRRGGPQLLRTKNLFSQLFSGFNLQSRFHRGSSSYGYNLYSITRLEDVKRPGLGARTWWQTPDEAFTSGISYQTLKIDSKMENIIGVDFRAVLNHFILTTEYVNHLTNGPDTWSYYVEPSLFIYKEELLAYVFIDYVNAPENKTGIGIVTLPDPIKVTEYGAGLNWLPTSYTRFRVGFTYHNYDEELVAANTQERDYYSFDLSAGVAF